MTREILWSIVGGTFLLCATAPTSLAITVGVDPAAPWQGYMNVSELPANGGAYVFGSSWGTADLVATFNGPVLTLAPNSVNDPNPFWYTPSGGPGSTGNKITEANMYVEPSGSLPGQSVTFTGNVLTNTLVDPYTSIAFIKDFAPDYSSWFSTTVPLTPGVFSITLDTINDPARHVQYGFATTGPCVWITDVGPKGTVTVTAAAAGVAGDYNHNGIVDAADYTVWRDGLGSTYTQADYDVWKTNFGNQSGSGSSANAAVPEPATFVLLLTGILTLGSCRRRTMS
jgi:hypothetical protein